jgi:hypothetical protein
MWHPPSYRPADHDSRLHEPTWVAAFAWAIGLVILYTAGTFLVGIDGKGAIFALAGAVWLSLSVFDFLLSRRTFAEISAPSTAAEVLSRHGEAGHYPCAETASTRHPGRLTGHRTCESESRSARAGAARDPHRTRELRERRLHFP